MDTDDNFNGKELLADLASGLSDVEAALEPLLNPSSYSRTSSDLPLLDRAKFNVLTAYTIESLIFSSLRLAGQDAKKHPVFNELARVRQYFDKIKKVESGGSATEKKPAGINKDAAARLIKGGLASNDRFDREKAVALEAQKTRARDRLEKLDLSSTVLDRPGDDENGTSKKKRKRAVDMLPSEPGSSKATPRTGTPTIEKPERSTAPDALSPTLLIPTKKSKTLKSPTLEKDVQPKKGSKTKGKKSKK